MNNKERYNKVFANSFDLDAASIDEKLQYQGIDAWDSVGHMELMAEMEDEFEIEMEADDIIDFSSYKEGMRILGKYGINFE